MTTELVPKAITPSEVFIPNGLDNILTGVEKIIAEEIAKPFDIEDEKDREQRKSFSYQISRSKTFVDDKGKTYVGEIKKKTKEIDAERKRFRDQMDKFRDDTREPVTKWEVAEKARVEAERQFEIYLMEWDEAIAEHSIFTREKEIEAKEAEFAKIEADCKEKEDAAIAEKERVENEAKIKEKAEAQAKFNASEEIKWAKIKRITDLGLVLTEDGIQWVKDDINISVVEFQTLSDDAFDSLIIKVKEEIDRRSKKAVDDARIAASERAKSDQEAAVKKAQEDAEAKATADRLVEALEASRLKDIAEQKASNKRHQASVNNKAKDGLMKTGITEKQATDIIIEIAQGRIPFLQINY